MKYLEQIIHTDKPQLMIDNMRIYCDTLNQYANAVDETERYNLSSNLSFIRKWIETTYNLSPDEFITNYAEYAMTQALMDVGKVEQTKIGLPKYYKEKK